METRDMTASLEIVKEINNQLGGNKFKTMTGAKNFQYGQDKTQNTYLAFSLPSNFAKNKINSVKIVLMPNDTYTVYFSKIWGSKITDISFYENIYCDQLQNLFTSVTGLDTHL